MYTSISTFHLNERKCMSIWNVYNRLFWNEVLASIDSLRSTQLRISVSTAPSLLYSVNCASTLKRLCSYKVNAIEPLGWKGQGVQTPCGPLCLITFNLIELQKHVGGESVHRLRPMLMFSPAWKPTSNSSRNIHKYLNFS